ncbi:MAG TPA: glycosyltransferase family 9 protein [Candidatus Binatia bacterium]|nr:glycosyltransferase family 9 protein [Candidatus Binatia bacterium]
MADARPLDAPPAAPPLPAPARVLVSRLRRIGDVILALPLVDALRERFPGARIDFLAEEDPAQAAVGHPAIDRVLSFRPSPSPLPAPAAVLRELRGARYDWTIDLYGNSRSAMLLALTGAQVRVGPARRGRRHLYTHVVPPVREPLSAIEHHLGALRALGIETSGGAPRIHLTADEAARGRERLDGLLPPGGARVGLHVGNRWPAKRWHPERFAALARALPGLGARALVLGGPGEEGTVAEVAERSGAPSLPRLPLREYWGVLAALDVLVTNDGSPLHAGPALAVPTVGILGPTVPEIWFPYGADEGHQLLHREIWCRPCHRHECARLDCLHWIGVGDALAAVARALERKEARLAPA